MTDDEQKGVRIGSHDAWVHLTRAGDWRPDDGMVSAVISVKGGPFTGTVLDHSFAWVALFCEELQSLYDTLSGSATLYSYDLFNLTAKGNGRGVIDASVELIADPQAELKFGMTLDQTYLPDIIKRLKREFPKG